MTVDFTAVLPFAAGAALRCRASALGVSFGGRVTVVRLAPDALDLAFVFAETRVLMKRVPETAFAFRAAVGAGQDGRDRTELEMATGRTPSGALAAAPIVDPAARIGAIRRGTAIRFETRDADGRPTAFTLARAGPRSVEVAEFAARRAPPRLKLIID